MQIYVRAFLILTLSVCLLANIVSAQNFDIQKPREETLLNELKLLIWSDPSSKTVTVKLRIHSGSAFDPKDKMGTVALLSDVIFPDEGIKKYFEEDLGGSLEITTDYDYIQINATAKSSEFLAVLDTLAPAILNPTLDKETTAAAKTKRLALLDELEKDPKYLAERAAREKLLGDFPYGRPKEGTRESLEKIDYADLIFAKDRFLAADNATMAIIGNVRSDFVYRAVRRYFGSWAKRTEKIPFSFKLPDAPDKDIKIIPASGEKISELRFAAKGVARNDSEYFRNLILAKVLEGRMVDTSKDSVVVSSNVLPGYVMFNFSDWNLDKIGMNQTANTLSENTKMVVQELLKSPVSEREFSAAKSSISATYKKRSSADLLLDTETYKLGSVKEDWIDLQKVTLANVNSAAAKWKNEAFAKALVVSKVDEPKLEQKPDPNDPE